MITSTILPSATRTATDDDDDDNECVLGFCYPNRDREALVALAEEKKI